MGILACILAILGGLCAVMGIITATEVVPLFGAELTWLFWIGIAVVLFLAAITSLIAQNQSE